jgi:putative membrane protein
MNIARNHPIRYGLIVCFLSLSTTQAHELELHPHVHPNSWSELWSAWALVPVVLAPLALSAFLYLRGLLLLWRATHVGCGISRGAALCYAGGWFTLFIALVSPIHPWGRVLFAVHMTQHEILMLLAAPLLALGQPLVAFLKALPPTWTHCLVRASHQPAWQRTWALIATPLAAWIIHAAALWIWHIPSFFEAALRNETLHAFQHLSFVLTALLFWWTVLRGPYRAMGYGLAVLSLFGTALHSGLLGALLTFGQKLFYPSYALTSPAWGFSALEDQQLAGLIMWVPAGLLYVIAGVILFGNWINAAGHRAHQRELGFNQL